MPEPSGSTGVQPSSEAIEAVLIAMFPNDYPGWATADRKAWRDDQRLALAAAYAIDAPAIHAAGQDAGVAQVRDLIGHVERSYNGDSGPLAEGAIKALAQLRTELRLRFGAEGST